MLTILKYILKNQQIKRLKSNFSTTGFTMIELLVSTIVAFLIITPLLFFVVNILETDKKEQWKTITDQELQSAVSFIANDLKQAVYIYGRSGVTTIGPQISKSGTPILVFWKQQLIENIVPANTRNADVQTDHCDSKPCDDIQVYSIVAYYLITGNTGSSPWSNAARIGRIEIRDGVRNPANYYDYLDENGNKMAKAKRDSGFRMFDGMNPNVAGTFEQKMEAWTPDGEITKNVEVLVDYIDHTSATDYVEKTPETDAVPDDTFCIKSLNSDNAQLVGEPTTNRGFYACVDSSESLAQLFIAGNGLARTDDGATYDQKQADLFPTVNITVKGRGILSGML
ncbi:MAG: hormogonium polysaccharide secretion pseudopilin HpsC [Trichodesmium sp. MAG_R03]|nr:hormogonium polysaccharide secretion pseudopilin HpsC [Trichodesmium sp. MAG_R03]